ncbi:hypothetical protein J6590_035078 [Homalodisca vitripennis]|nr:hypothetical protein J6590_035078 [Homalodisca vitripennis]
MQEYRDARRGLRQAITVSKASRWKELKDDLNADPWGLGYQIVMRRLGAQSASPNMSAAQLEISISGLGGAFWFGNFIFRCLHERKTFPGGFSPVSAVPGDFRAVPEVSQASVQHKESGNGIRGASCFPE